MNAQLKDVDTTDAPPLAEGPRRSFLGFGAAFILLGCLALGHLAVASLISTFIIGLVMLAGSALHFGQEIGVRRADAGWLWPISGAFYLLAGLAVLFEPVVSEPVLALALAITLVISGVSRLVIGIQHRAEWVLLGGAATIIVGVIIGIDWPRNSLWLIGALIGLDLLAQGLGFLITGISRHFAATRSTGDRSPDMDRPHN